MHRSERLKQLLQELSALFGPSGNEDAVRDYIVAQIKDYADYVVDNLGNLIVEKKGKARPLKRVMLDAHMDEVGVIITAIGSDGLLSFETIGGVTTEALFGKTVDFGAVQGVIGGVPIHLLRDDQKSVMPVVKDLTINVGCSSQEHAATVVSVGDVGVFSGDFVAFGSGFIKAKALDDRAGCAILIDMIQSALPYDMTFTFTVREELGLMGAKTAAYQVEPDVALVLETTTAADVAGSDFMTRVCSLGEGAVVSFMDRATLYHLGLYDLAFKVAKRSSIAVQSKNAVAGGNNAGAIHNSGKGIPTLALSLPCRYLHSSTCVIHENDLIATAKLAKQMAVALASGESYDKKC